MSVLFALLAFVPGMAPLPHSCFTELHTNSSLETPWVCRPDSDNGAPEAADHCLACALQRTLLAQEPGGVALVVDMTATAQPPLHEGAERSEQPESLPPARGPPSV